MASNPRFSRSDRCSIRCRSLLTAWLLLLAGPLGADMLLVENGHPRTAIVVATQPYDIDALAATELQLYVKKTTGALIPIVGDTARISAPRILIGDNSVSRKLELNLDKLGRDGYLIQKVDTDLVLRGATEHGTLNAAYAFLENYLQVRWFMPGELGEDILPRSTVSIPDEVHEKQTPDFHALYGLKWSGYSPGAPAWERRNRACLNETPLCPARYFFEHSFHKFIHKTDATREAHPDWFARDIHGTHKRSGQLCTTNPEVVKVTIENSRGLLR